MDTREPEDETLEAWVARTRPDTATRDAVAESILRVLAAAHRRGAAHPGLTAGHVHVHEDDGTVAASITGFDHPPVIDSPKPDVREDVRSAGTILYTLLTGEVCSTAAFVRLRSEPPDLPARVTAALEAALEPDADRRAPDSGALLAIWRGARSGARALPTVRGAKATIAAFEAPEEPPPAPTAKTDATHMPVRIAVACVVLALIAWIVSCAPSAPPHP